MLAEAAGTAGQAGRRAKNHATLLRRLPCRTTAAGPRAADASVELAAWRATPHRGGCCLATSQPSYDDGGHALRSSQSDGLEHDAHLADAEPKPLAEDAHATRDAEERHSAAAEQWAAKDANATRR